MRGGVARKDFAQIEKALLQIIEAESAVPDNWISLIDHAIKFEKLERAAAHFRVMNRTELDEGAAQLDVRKARVRIALRLGDNSAAAEEAAHWSEDFDGDPQNALYAMRAFARAGQPDRFTAAVKALQALAADNEVYLAEACHLQNNLGYSAQVVEFFKDRDAEEFQSPALLYEWGKAELAARFVSPAACAALERAFALDMNLARVRQGLATAYTRSSRHAEALELLNDPKADKTDSTDAARAELLLEVGRYNDAVELYEKLVAKHPSHRGWRRALVGSYVLAGNSEKANAAYQQDIGNRQVPITTTFHSSLEDIELDLSAASIPAHRFEWMYRRLAHLGHVPTDRKAWEDDCRWVNLADLATLNWLETRTSAVDEITEHFVGADEGLDELRFYVDKGFGCFLSTVHVGALFAGPLALAKSGLDYRWVASTPVVDSVPGSKNLFSTYSLNRLQLARASYRAVRSGSVVSLAIDGGITSMSRALPFAGDHILVSDFVPRAIYQTGAPSFFPIAAWEDQKVIFDLARLPMPEPTQTQEEFIDTWLAAFATTLEEFLVRFPTNPRLSGGFWSHVRL